MKLGLELGLDFKELGNVDQVVQRHWVNLIDEVRFYSTGGGDGWLANADASGNVGGAEFGLVWVDSFANTITLYRGATDTSWNYVRVRLWKPR